MKLKFMIMMAVLSLGVFTLSGQVSAQEKGSMMGEKGSHHTEATESGAVKVGNTICPVSKEKVGEMGSAVEYEHEGKIYNFCCKMCLKDFKKDPQKYSKIAEESVAGEEVGESHEGHNH